MHFRMIVDADPELTHLAQLCRRVTDPGLPISCVVHACIPPQRDGSVELWRPGSIQHRRLRLSSVGVNVLRILHLEQPVLRWLSVHARRVPASPSKAA
jgi:hypothetical protein